MSRFTLLPPRAAEKMLRDLSASADGVCELSVREDQCFNEGRLSLGSIVFPAGDSGDGPTDGVPPLVTYEWHLPDQESVRKSLATRLGIELDAEPTAKKES